MFCQFRFLSQSFLIGWFKRYDLRTVQYMSEHKWISTTEISQIDLQESLNKWHLPGLNGGGNLTPPNLISQIVTSRLDI